MNKIEEDLQEKQNKHDMLLSQVQSEVQLKNKKWLEKNLKLKEEEERKAQEEQKKREMAEKILEKTMVY